MTLARGISILRFQFDYRNADRRGVDAELTQFTVLVLSQPLSTSKAFGED